MKRASRNGWSSIRAVGWMAALAAVMTVGLITYGAWVRVSGSGLGCPDWPLCNGVILPQMEGDTAIEFGHRAYAGVTALVVGLAALMSLRIRASHPKAARVVLAAFVLILVQAVLGGITVLTELHGMVRLVHLSTALIILALLTWAALLGFERKGVSNPSVKTATGLLVGAAFVVLMGAAIVGTNNTGACPALPVCDGRSSLEASILHALHRGASLLLLGGVIAVGFLLRGTSGARAAVAFNHTAALLILLQGIVGITAVVQSFPGSLRILHVALAVLTWWALVAQFGLVSIGQGRRN